MKRAFAALVLCFSSIVAVNLGTAAPASAATGCSAWGPLAPSIPSGTLCFTIKGSGTRIDSMQGDFTSPGRVCNWRIDWRIYYKGATWWYSKGPDHLTCNFTGIRTRGAGSAPAGSQMCAQLVNISTGNRIEGACLSIN